MEQKPKKSIKKRDGNRSGENIKHSGYLKRFLNWLAKGAKNICPT
jgi:hypothetical protein